MARSTIELLSEILHENVDVKVKAETFRAAKFNRAEAVSLLLKECTYFLHQIVLVFGLLLYVNCPVRYLFY